MIRKLSAFLLYRVLGWKCNVTEPMVKKGIIALAPHTTNFDFILGILYSRAERIKSNFLMKKEWFFWPLGFIMRKLGGIPVYRSKKMSMTDQLAKIAKANESFMLCITPEGTRSRVEEWKRGFYYIAQKAELPILLYGIDYQTKTITCTKTIIPNGDVEGQMREIKAYYKDFKGKHPEKFSVGKI